MAKDIYFTKEHDQFRRAMREFVNKEINPYVDEWEANGIAPLKDLFKKMGDLGFLGLRYDEKYGGVGLGYWYELGFLGEIAHIPCGGGPHGISG